MIQSAGVLPHCGRFVLLGLEQSKGGGWSAFSGKGRRGESAEETARREFLEETCHAFDASLTDGMRELVRSSTPSGGLFVLFGVELPSRCSLDRFYSNREASADRYCREKTKVEWFDLDRLPSPLRPCFASELPRIRGALLGGEVVHAERRHFVAQVGESAPPPDAAMDEAEKQEILRRAEMAKRSQPRSEAAAFAPSKRGGTVDAAGQAFVLFSLSHVSFSPFCTDPRNPGIRFCGTFASADEAREQGAVLAEGDGCSAFIHPLGEWGIASPSPASLSSGAADRIRSRLDACAEREAASSAEFEANVSERKAGEAGEGGPEGRAPPLPVQGGEAIARRTLPPSLRLGQGRFAVVSFESDSVSPPSDPAEFLFRVYAAFDSEEECDCFVRDVLSADVTRQNIDVVAMHEWLFPQNVKGHMLGREEFRDQELDSIIKTHRAQPARVAAFEREAKEASSD